MKTFEILKFISFLSTVLVIASIITFSLFIKNIYENMDEIREKERLFTNLIVSNESRLSEIEKNNKKKKFGDITDK
jgi:hypothetical protein